MRTIIVGVFLFCYSFANGQDHNLPEKIAALHGTYKHFLPCGNCTGVETMLALDCEGPCNKGSYVLKEESVNSINGDRGNESKGTWAISDTIVTPGETILVISLRDEELKEKTRNYFLYTAGNLEQLDKKKQRMDPPFNLVLKKLDNAAILDLR